MTLDEDAFLAKLFPRLPAGPHVCIGPGDDCAAIDWHQDTLLLLATDQLVAGTHYIGPDKPGATAPRRAGRKLLARNLSDIAAMGGTPTYALVSFAGPKDLPETWLDAFMDGVVSLAREFDVAIIGGDLARAPQPVASLTIVGTVPRDQVCRRNGATPGDVICVTGALGASLARGHHLHFDPRCREGRWLAEQRLARAMIDLSDGLVVDLRRLCRASGVEARLNTGSIPRNCVAGQPVELRQALFDGEDYELLFAVDPTAVRRLRRDWPFPVSLSEIGSCVDAAEEAGRVHDTDGALLVEQPEDGFRHFA
jgi:thiamine-monophosphate kinase